MSRRVLAVAPWAVAGLLLGLATHIGSILLLPKVAPADARTRIEAALPINRMSVAADPDALGLPLIDPAFESAYCPYDLSAGILRLRAPLTPHYTTVTIYGADGLPFAALNDRAGADGAIELALATSRQRRDLPQGEDDVVGDLLIVTAPSARGVLVIRALAATPSMRSILLATLAEGARCDLVAPDQVGR